MAHNGLQERAQALSTPVDQPTGETQITGRVDLGVGNVQGPQTQSAQANVESQGVAFQSLGSQVQNAKSTAETQIPVGQGVAGPQAQSASTTDKLLETMNNMVSFMASQQQQQSLAATNAPSVSLSSLRSMTVDTKGILTVDDYWGEKEKFLGWKRILYSAFEAINPMWEQACKHIETDTKRKVPLSSLTPEESVMAHDIHRFLLHKCKGDAATRVQSSEDGNGFEAWRLLCDSKLPKSSTASFSSLRLERSTSESPAVG